MFKLFQSVFGGEEKKGHYSESLIKKVIERAVDGTDPRIRILPGYAKALRKPVIHAIDHVITLIEALPPPVMATQAGHGSIPTLETLFTSTTRMHEIFSNDHALHEYQAATPSAETVYALLVVQRHEKQGFGYGLIDDKLVSDVKQTLISFDQHRLVDIANSEEENRRLLRHRAFDYLLSLALAQVGEQHDEREKLSQQRSLLKVKFDILQKGGSGFSGDIKKEDRAALQTRLEEVEIKLASLGPAHEVLHSNLDIIISTLENAEKHLWGEEVELRIDQHGVLCQSANTSVPAIRLHDLCDSSGRRVTIQLISLSPSELPQRPDLSAFLASRR